MMTPTQVALHLCRELERTCGLASNSIDVQIPCLLDTEILAHVSDELWESFTEAIDARCHGSEKIHGHWSENDEDVEAVFVRMGIDVWQSTRCDRFKGSRIMSMANNDPVDSPNRLQTIKVVKASTPVEKTSVTPEHQLMAHFLRAGIRLNSTDISKVMRTIIDQKVH